MAEAREARRQRILRRGADRLAYITGESKSLGYPSEKKEHSSSLLDRNGGFLGERIETVSEDDGQQRNATSQSLDELDKTTLQQRRPSSSDQQEESHKPADPTSSNPSSTNPPPKFPATASSISSWKALSSSIDSSRLARCLVAVATAVTAALTTGCIASENHSNIFTTIRPAVLLFTTNAAIVAGLALLKLNTTTATAATSKNTKLRLVPGMWGDTVDVLLVARKITSSLSADLSTYLVAMTCVMACRQPFVCS